MLPEGATARAETTREKMELAGEVLRLLVQVAEGAGGPGGEGEAEAEGPRRLEEARLIRRVGEEGRGYEVTPQGRALLRPASVSGGPGGGAVGEAGQVGQADGAVAGRETPRYEQDELWWRGRVLTRFERLGTAQERLVEAFAAAEWVEEIDNPFQAEGNPKRKLTDTAKNLTRRLEGTIRFRATARGRVRWGSAEV